MKLQFVSSVWSVGLELRGSHREQKARLVVGLMICYEVKTTFLKRIEALLSWKWSDGTNCETQTVYQPTESSERISSFFRTEKQTSDNPWKKQQLHSTAFRGKLITVCHYCGYTLQLLCYCTADPAVDLICQEHSWFYTQWFHFSQRVRDVSQFHSLYKSV